MKKFLLSFYLATSLLVVAQPALAQDNSACDTLRARFQNVNGVNAIDKLPNYCNTSNIYQKIVYTLYWLIGIVAVIMVIYGGYLYMTSRGNETQVARARAILTWTVIGLIIAILATVLVNIVVKAVVENKLV